MDKRAIELIINELQERIAMEEDELEIEGARALKEFEEWFFEIFVL